MKKLFFFFVLMAAVSFTMNAQKACCAKSKTASTEKVCTQSAAAKLASLDENIETRTCAKSGTVSYVRKSTCPASGKVSYANVSYDASNNTFVNVSPSATEKKATCTKSAKAAKVSMTDTEGKACPKGKAACCAKGAKSAKSTKTAQAGEAKLVKAEAEESMN